MSEILDSGNRTEFSTGAVRDVQEGKGDFSIMPMHVVADFLASDVLHCIANYMDDPKNTDSLELALEEFCDEAYHRWTEAILEVAVHFEQGCKKYGRGNWTLGIPVSNYINSACRHYLKWERGDKDERHDRAFVWNILCLIWTVRNKPEMIDIDIED